MSQAPFSVIVPTIGRPTLTQALASCDDPLVGEVLISPDGRQAWNAVSEAFMLGIPHKGRLLEPVDESRMNQFGHPQRNRACMAARHPWLLFMDDDDVFVPGAFATILLNLDGYRPHIFKMVHGQTSGNELEGTVLWQDPELRECNVATPMFVVPNRALGWWPSRRAGDFGFIEETCRLQGPPVFVDQVICEVRPRAHDRV